MDYMRFILVLIDFFTDYSIALIWTIFHPWLACPCELIPHQLRKLHPREAVREIHFGAIAFWTCHSVSIFTSDHFVLMFCFLFKSMNLQHNFALWASLLIPLVHACVLGFNLCLLFSIPSLRLPWCRVWRRLTLSPLIRATGSVVWRR